MFAEQSQLFRMFEEREKPIPQKIDSGFMPSSEEQNHHRHQFILAQFIARFLGLPTPGFKGVMEWVLKLRKEINIPHTLKEIGVDDKRVDEVAKAAEADPSAGGNPIKVGAAELGKIFVAGLNGTLAA